nr:hypothetical protein [Tanacetum cinerariifolium]
MNMLNNKCRTSFAKPEFLKKAQRANPRMYDIGCYNDNLALMLAPESDDAIRLEKESRSKLNDLIRPFDYDKLNNLYDLFVPQPLQKHAINLEIDLQQCQEKIKMTNLSKEFRNEREQYFEIQDLKAQVQDKGIVINFLERKDFSKSKSVTQNNVSNDFSKPVTAQTLPPNKKSILNNTNVLAPGMYKLHTEPTQARTSQLPQDSRKINKPVSFSTGVIPTTIVSRPQLKSNPIEDKVMLNNSKGNKQEVEDQRRNVKLSKNKTSVTACNDSLNAKTLNVNFVCATYGKCVLKEKHDMCVLKSVNSVNSRTKMPIILPVSTREPKCTVKQYVAKPLKKTVASESNQKPRNITRKLYERVKIVLFIVNSGCSKHMTGNLKLLINFVEKFLGTVKFGNDQIAPILGYGDLVQGAVTIKRVYYVKGLNHNLFSVGSRGTDLYSITLQDINSTNLICLMGKATSSQAWLWHHRLSHLNFNTINLLSKNDIVVGLSKLKFIKDHLCSSWYSTQSRAYKVFNKRTRVILETIHVNFDELPQMALDHVSSDPGPEFRTVTTSNELDLLFSPMFDELINGSSHVVSKSSAVTTADANNQRQQQNKTPLKNQTTPDPTCQVPPHAPTVASTENMNQAEMVEEYAQVENDEFINIFCTSKDHPLEQVIGNPSQSIRTRRQLESDVEMCMFTLTVSQTEPKNIKEAMVNSAWIESMQEELHQFD